MQQRATVADRVRAARGRRFVGRATERELFRQAVEAPGEPPFTVLHLHGPGGIGKTALLRVFADDAAAAGAGVVRIDARDIAPDRDAVRAAAAPALAAEGRTVLLVDGYDLLAPLDGWVREDLLAGLPADGVAVLAGRAAPAPGWTDDPGWRALVRSVALGPLSDAEAHDWLAGAGLAADDRERVVAFASGYPLVLVLAAEHPDGDALGHLTAPEAVGHLAGRLLDAAPSARHARAVQLCARARVTTERLLRAVLDDGDAGELFAWLRHQPWVEHGTEGLRAHDVVREVVLRDAAWRDPAAAEALSLAYYTDVFDRVRGGAGPVRETGLLDAVYDTRHSPALRDFYDWTTFGAVAAEPYRVADRDGVAEVLARWLAPADAAAVLGWCDRQPDGVVVYREHGRVDGVVVRLQLHEADPAVVSADPVTALVRARAAALGIGPDDTVTVDRCALDRRAGTGPSPAFNLACEQGLRNGLTRADLALDAVATSDPDRLEGYYTAIGYARLDVLHLPGGRVGVHAADWRTAVPQGWWECLPPRGHRSGEPDAAFADAVRLALRDLGRPERLGRSPLVAAGVAGDGPGLRAALLAAVDGLRGHPRDRKLHRALDRTYVRPAPTQERAAEVLGLPFSTYRRHLTTGVARVAECLWSGAN